MLKDILTVVDLWEMLGAVSFWCIFVLDQQMIMC